MIQSAIAKPRRASDETVKWNGGSVTAAAGGRANICTPIRGLAQGYRPTRRWRRFYRIRLSFDQRRAGGPGSRGSNSARSATQSQV